jgi:hypothetical protein
VYRFLTAVIVLSLSWSLASAQTDIPDALKNRPPVAAPTSSIEVAPIEVVRSKAELINDFGGGLLQGLLASHGLEHAALIAAQDDRVIVTRDFGSGDFGEVSYSGFLAPLAVLQLAERQKLKLEDGVSSVVAGYGVSAVKISDVLSQRADPDVLRRIVEAASGQDFRTYVSQNIVEPLAGGDNGQPVPFAQTIGRLLVALINDGAFEGTQIFAPETIALMRQTQFSIHSVLPGWTYGFGEMKRNGWRALQRDGAWLTTPATEARMVIVPDAHIAYAVVVEGHPGAVFWRTFDDALFDRILPPGDAIADEVPAGPAPSASQANEVAGTYEASDEPLSAGISLRFAAQRLLVRADADGSLHLSGSENAVLKPQPGGYWAADGGNLNAVLSDGRLVLTTGLYRPLSWWKRPLLYAMLTLIFALGAAGAFASERRKQTPGKSPSTLVSVLAIASAALLFVTFFVWHLTPVL